MRRAFLRHTLVVTGLVCLLGSTPSLAANVVQVRIGNHPTFTRVVFELDAPAGYRIQNAVDQDVKELVVTLEAASTPRSVRSGSPEVGLVSVQDGAVTTVAHIRLRRGIAGVKELILNNPPRIVIDLMREPSLIAAQKATAVAATTAKATAAEPAPAEALEAKPAEATAKAVVAPVAPKLEAKPAPIPVIPMAEPKLAQTPDAPKPEAKAVPALPTKTPEPLASSPVPAPVAEPVVPVPSEGAETAEAAPPETPIPAPEASSFGLEPMQLAALAGGALLLIILVVLLLRRRRLPNDLDVTALVDEDDDLGPAASISEGLDFGAGERVAEPAPQRHAPAAPEAPLGNLFADTDQDLFDTPEKGERKMSQDALDLPVSRGGRPAATQATPASAGDSDVGRLVRELERRVAQLETRLDEGNDARERLERQVAAQSEELRVQRAAIARTQRALRGLNRGEDEQATEPALRDPNRPMGGN